MNKLLITILYILLAINFANAQSKYDKLWLQVENLELEGKFKDANNLVNKILSKADKSKKSDHIVKGFIYKSKFTMLLSEDSQSKIIYDLRIAINKYSFPTNAILHSVYAEFLNQYLNRNRYKISRRTKLLSQHASENFLEWDIANFNLNIAKHYEKSLSVAGKLKKISIDDFKIILTSGKSDKNIRPTLYDFLAYRVIEFYKNKRSDSSQTKLSVYINNANIFANSSVFVKQKFVSDNVYYSLANIFTLYQQLESLHLSTNPTAYVDVVVSRLKLARQKSILNNKDELYLEALKKLSNRFDNKPSSAIINYTIAQYYYQKSNSAKAKHHETFKNYRTKALAICNSVLRLHPNSDAGMLCRILKHSITKKVISIKANNYQAPDKAILNHVSFCNIDSVYISAYRVAATYTADTYQYKRDSALLVLMDTQKPVVSKLSILPIKKDHYTYTTELAFPALSIGKYILVSSKKLNIDSIDQIYNYAEITITNLSIIKIDRENNLKIKILDRETGAIKEGVDIIIKDTDEHIIRGKTDAKGEFSIKKNRRYKNFSIQASFNNDTIIEKHNYLYASTRRDKKEKTKAKMILYLDRSIYRPGQKIYFKGLLIEKKDGKSSVVANTYASIIFRNVNGEKIKTFKLKTNQYGSISGEYTLPKTGRMGNFSIYMERYKGSDENYYKKIDTVDRDVVYFSVEEYKRPKFEVRFKDINENYRLGDSIKIEGFAKAFLGANLVSAKVKYSITREKEEPWRYNRYGNSNSDMQAGIIKTNSKGEFTIKFIASGDSLISKKEKPIFIYTIKTDVTDTNGETQSNTKSIRIAYHNLELTCKIAKKLNADIEQEIVVETKNLNNKAVEAKIELTIEKLISPKRILITKKWAIAELPSMLKDDYIKLFPHQAYDKTDIRTTWVRGKKVFTKKIEASGNKKFVLKNISKWQPGAYNMQIMAIDIFQDTIIQNKQFVVYRNSDKHMSDEQMFDYEIINTDFRKDKKVELKLKTACKNLKINLEAYYLNKLVFSKIIDINKGTSLVEIPVDDKYKNKLDISIYFVKFNSLNTKKFTAKFIEPKTNIEIETLSFRNKLLPGKKETWSFKIINHDKTNANAELLASMYDTSLDQFKNHNWTTNIDIKNHTYSYSPQARSNFFGLNYFNNFNFKYAYTSLSQEKKYKQMRWFGFNLGNTKYSNSRYLSQLLKLRNNKKQQNGNINGYIVDQEGYPLPGASIIIKGTRIGTSSDMRGYYSIKAPLDSELMINVIGFESKTIKISKTGILNIVLAQSNSPLEEIVILSNGASPRAKSGLLNQLQGRVVGISVMDELEEDEDEDEESISIRGSSSLKNNTASLYIVDGEIVSATFKNNMALSYIIDIKILKGNRAIDIYGSKARNGVIIITTKKGLGALSQVQARENLNETAFFFPHLSTNTKGEVIFSFDSPQALTRWKLMLFAHNKFAEHAYIQKMVYTQKNINVITNVPRFFREGDIINITSKIINLTKTSQTGIAALQLFDATSMQPIDYIITTKANKSFAIPAEGNTALSWELKIPKGISAIQYKIVAKAGNHSDGEMNIIPVLSNRTLITEAKPIWVPAHKSKDIVFLKLKQGSSDSQQNHNFTIEYTSNPAWMAIKSLPYLMEFPYEGAEQTFSRFYSNALAESIIVANPKIEKVFEQWRNNKSLQSPLETNAELKSILIEESPWLKDLKSDKEQKANIANLFDKEKISKMQRSTINKLKEMQLKSGAFPWFEGGRANRFITQHIVAGIGHLNKLKVKTSANNLLKPILKKAISYLDYQFMKNSKEDKQIHKDNFKLKLNHHIIHYLYSRSFFLKDYPLDSKTAKVTNLYLEKCKDEWITHSIYDKALIALCLHRNNYIKTSKNILEAISQQSIINDEKGMYWKENKASYYWYKSPIETQALLIEAYAEIKNNKKELEAMKQWLMMNKQTKHWGSTKATTEATYALLMHGQDYTSIKGKTVIKLSGRKIKAEKLLSVNTEAETGYIKLSWKQEEITPSMAQVRITNKSNIIGFGAAYWQYFEDMDKVRNSANSPLSIQKTMYINEINNKGKTLIPISDDKAIKNGDLITVRLVIKVDTDIEFVHLKDLRASGLEPISVLSKYEWQDGLGYYKSTKDAATHFFFDRLPQGTYVFEYDLRANNSGNFSNGNASIQSMYAPEFIGNSKGARLIIKD